MSLNPNSTWIPIAILISSLHTNNIDPLYWKVEGKRESSSPSLFSNIVEEVLKQELKSILVSFKRDKILGPDGWLVEFFISFYDLLKEDLIRVIEEEKSTRSVLGVFNSTFLALIPKKGKQEVVDQIKLISLCN